MKSEKFEENLADNNVYSFQLKKMLLNNLLIDIKKVMKNVNFFAVKLFFNRNECFEILFILEDVSTCQKRKRIIN